MPNYALRSGGVSVERESVPAIGLKCGNVDEAQAGLEVGDAA
jgi:hypothetical protein